MPRVKGWTEPWSLVDTESEAWCINPVYVEEIPSDVVRFEDTVNDYGVLKAETVLPRHLIGKRVEVIVMEAKE